MTWYITKEKNRISKKKYVFLGEEKNVEKYINIWLKAEKKEVIRFDKIHRSCQAKFV